MSDNQTMGFGKFVPGFDFLQNLAKGASQSMPQMPQLANWVAPTLNVEELERRIGELKAVHFWLDQNSKALGATIQALEVQKMTLATLKGMNFNMAELANAMKLKADAMMGGLSGGTAGASVGRGNGADEDAEVKADVDVDVAKTAARPKPRRAAPKKEDAAPAASVVDPMQWWGSLTQQFQQIAANALKDVAAQAGMDSATNMATGAANEAMKTASGMANRKATGTGTGATSKSSSTPANQRARKAPVKRAKKKGGA